MSNLIIFGIIFFLVVGFGVWQLINIEKTLKDIREDLRIIKELREDAWTWNKFGDGNKEDK